MQKLPRQVYAAEFRQQAVVIITRDGLGDAEAVSSRRLSIWLRSMKGGSQEKRLLCRPVEKSSQRPYRLKTTIGGRVLPSLALII